MHKQVRLPLLVSELYVWFFLKMKNGFILKSYLLIIKLGFGNLVDM